MAKTNPSGRAKSKTPAPKKALTPIEKRIISLEVRLSAGAKVRGLQDARITKLELYGTANVDSWIEQHDNRIKAIEGRLDKLASSTVAVEEKWVPKVGDWVVCIAPDSLLIPVGGIGQIVEISAGGNPRIRYEKNSYADDGLHTIFSIRWSLATPEEIAAHEAKLKAEAQAAEDAKLVFGARVESVRNRIEYRLACDSPDANGKYRLAPKQACHYDAPMLERHEFTLLP